MKWQLQVLRGAVKTAMPFQPTLRRLKRSVSTYTPSLDNLNTTLDDLSELINLLRTTGRDVKGRTILEIGSGWFPVIPILYIILGAPRVVMSDLNRYMDDGTFRSARDYIRQNADRVADRLQIDPLHIVDVLEGANTLADLGLDYRVPFDTRDQPSGSMDLITSRTVLEHIPADALAGLLPDWARLLSADGVMAHAIDMSDHFEHSDKTISRVNFLCFSARVWRLINAASDYQNRLRHSDFLSLFARHNLDVLALKTDTDDRARRDLARLELAPPFDRMSPDDLAILTSYVVLKPKVSARPS